jgi:hypothetical protein
MTKYYFDNVLATLDVSKIERLALKKSRTTTILQTLQLFAMIIKTKVIKNAKPWTNFSRQDDPRAEFSTLEVAACIPCAYCPV